MGSQVLSYDSEISMLEAWRDFVEKVDPDVVIGYNIANFDLPYLLDRSKALKSKKFHFLGRLKSKISTLSHSQAHRAFCFQICKQL